MVVDYKGITFSDLDLFTSRVLVPAIGSLAKAYPYLLPYIAMKSHHSTKKLFPISPTGNVNRPEGYSLGVANQFATNSSW